jgi:hypothetical protein
LDIDEELCACSIDWYMAFDCVNWTKFMQILKSSGIDWHEKTYGTWMRVPGKAGLRRREVQRWKELNKVAVHN